MSVILKAENISKQYRLGTVGTGSLQHDLNRWWHTLRGKEDPYLKVGGVNDRSTKATEDYVWALRDINFEVKQGEVLGIIGKNGAGKSTLLKLLSRVTAPTTGSIKTKGRIASLLEVGTGFHGELTGRENIFMNGAVLGMSRAEIKNKLDEIIAFSGCEKYIDTPVKRYSSGMTVRLGFAVAAHLEPEILVVDEVLAVGDAEFQKKAIGKMQDLSTGEGRTVLFVSHNMASVKNLCSRAIQLKNGQVCKEGDVEKVIEHYLKNHQKGQTNISLLHPSIERTGNGEVRINSVSVYGEEASKLPQTGKPLTLKFHLENKKNYKLSEIVLEFRIDDNIGQRLIWNSTKMSAESDNSALKTITARMDKCILNKGHYSVTLYLRVRKMESDWIQNAFSFKVEEGLFYSSGIEVPPTQSKILTEFNFQFNDQ
ncbi:ABC transporter ATP-binding protein [Christiangramia sp. OXR-203]|uniref:ABC transporter ATP-binding protein n=1 Tax=Christiangramia sp. OXR-203 TaxID=3100176 RepID=UPI002AC93F02|nr:ABC transporter ATP-binding protein [Christiangramia sp. OXR-203]WPY97915.1 ABC transporter ATP-binding protein [Christiangramia sp. OXR-203]